MRASLCGIVASSLLFGGSALAAPPLAGHGSLVSAHSGLCLADSDAPRAGSCERAADVALQPAGRGRVMIRNQRTGACLYSNHDGRFGWYACTPQYGDQYWSWLGDGEGDALVRANDSNQCLFSNADGRFGLFACHPEYGDQHWRHVARRGDEGAVAVSIVGDWSWVDGARTAMRADGSFVMPDDGGGLWRQRGPGRFEVRWGDGHRDDVVLSPDGLALAAPGGRVLARRTRAVEPPRPAPPLPVAPAVMDASAFDALAATLRTTGSEIDKREVLLATVRRTRIDAAQLMQLLDLFRSEVTKLQVVRGAVARVVDPRDVLAYGPRLRSSASRVELARIIAAVPDEEPPSRQPPPPSQPHPQAPSQPQPARPDGPRKQHVCKPIVGCAIGCPGPMAHDEYGCGLCACEDDSPAATLRRQR